MTECNAIIEANNEIDRLKKENKKLNALCVQYGFDMGKLEEENEELKNDNDTKFWELQCMQQINSTRIILQELAAAIEQGYKTSDDFKKYMDKIREDNKQLIEKNKRLFDDFDES